MAPRTVRMLVRLACGVAAVGPLAALPATTGHATGLPLPDRPDVTAERPTDSHAATLVTPASLTTATDPAATVTVRPGDSLWSIAAAHLPDDATVGDVAAAWPRWYAANRAAIGPDPDLIHPGTRLRVPDRTDLEEH